MAFLGPQALVLIQCFTRKCSLSALIIIKLLWFRKKTAHQMGITGQELQFLTWCGSFSAVVFRQTTTLQKQWFPKAAPSDNVEKPHNWMFLSCSKCQTNVRSDQSANAALLAPAKPSKTSRGNNIFCTSGIIPLKLPRKSNVRIVWVLHWMDSLEGNIQRVKHKWRATQHFI